MNLNGNNVIDSLESSLDEDMFLVVKGEGSLTIKTVLEHEKNENPYSIVAILYTRYNEQTKEYEDEIYFFVMKVGGLCRFPICRKLAWNKIKNDALLSG
ncbi:MAG: hypothetical protein K2L12_06275 [Clostridia bacterium]|nr:hypothetical protein [Clostridia bacterium]